MTTAVTASPPATEVDRRSICIIPRRGSWPARSLSTGRLRKEGMAWMGGGVSMIVIRPPLGGGGGFTRPGVGKSGRSTEE